VQKLAVLASGMMTGVGLNAPASCAAIRCGINNVQETRFMDKGGEWINGSMVPLEKPWRGLEKLKYLVVPAVRVCLTPLKNYRTEHIPLFLCVAEKERPGRLAGLDEQFLVEVQRELGETFHPQSCIIAEGRVGPVIAIKKAMELIGYNQISHCIVAGVDSFLVAGTLSAYMDKLRLLTSDNSNGFIPGEAGAAVLLGNAASAAMTVQGIGFGMEKAAIESEEPLRADGLVQAVKEALTAAGLNMADIDFRITDANGEQYKFKEATLALTRILRERKEEFDIWHPVDCVGEIGAATVPVVIGVAEAAIRKQYAPGNNILCHFGNDDGRCAAVIVTFSV
jgi:3-oxoacyl-[acyl-carrier-protein] synthase-1